MTQRLCVFDVDIATSTIDYVLITECPVNGNSL